MGEDVKNKTMGVMRFLRKREKKSEVRKLSVSTKKIIYILLYIWPAVLYFSYFPVMHLGADATMNFEFSLPLIYLVVFDIFMVILLSREKRWGEAPKLLKWVVLPVWLTVTVFWSLNFTRGILTAGIVWLMVIAGYGMWACREVFSDSRFRKWWLRVFFASAIVAVIWCAVQCAMDLSGLTQEVTLMCDGCKYEMFGFPHPNGMAIEPQFMGNLLLAPAIVAGYMWTKEHKWGMGAVVLVLSVGIFLTFSRGAIYAYVIAMIIMVAVTGAKYGWWKRGAMVMGVVALAFVLTLCAQGAMAEVSQTDDTFITGVNKVINHLTLGVIGGDGRVRESGDNGDGKMVGTEFTIEENVDNGAGADVVDLDETVDGGVELKTVDEEADLDKKKDLGEGEAGMKAMDDNLVDEVGIDGKKEAVFQGYVAESTDTRVRLTNAAFTIWRRDFATVMAGVGLGGAGRALYNNGLSPAPKEIVQNEYASLLLETGLIGAILFIYTVGLAVKVLWRKAGVVVVVIGAYLITLMFFSGVANAMHIYLLPVMLGLIFSFSLKNKR